MRQLLLCFAILQFACSVCPDGFDLVEGECRGLYTTMNMNDAEAGPATVARCKEIQGLPIILHNEEHNSYWAKRGGDGWAMGLVCNLTSERWEWGDGSAVDYIPHGGTAFDEDCTYGSSWYGYKDGNWIQWNQLTPGLKNIFCTTQPQLPTTIISNPTMSTQRSTNPTQLPSNPTQRPSNPTQPPSNPTQFPSNPTQRPSNPTQLPTQPPTRAPVTVAPRNATDNYCNCGIVDDWFDNWEPTDIWVDVVIVLDTSKSMGSSLEEAKSVITSFVGVMSTDTTAEFYSRIGVIAVSDTVEVIYNLNMSSDDDLDSVQQHKIDKIDVGAAFQAALKMFADGSKMSSYRENAQQIIYYLTNSAPGANMNGVDDFKTGGGIIIVNDFILEGEVADPGLQKLASDDFFFTDLSENYINSLGVFCEANCFCAPDAHPFNDDENSPRTRANRGCYHPVNNGIPQQKARETCQKEHGSLVSIHDSEKEFFVNSVVSIFGPKKKFWLGLQYDGTQWNWDDKSTDPFTDWDVKNGQPNTNDGKLQCAYAQQGTGFNTPWTAANCAMGGIIYVCESPPCSIGYKNCL